MPPYSDTDFHYFDTEKRTVIGPVEWTKTGNVKPLLKPGAPEESGDRRRRGRPRKEYYIWGTYRSLKRLYNLEGKVKREESTQTLDEAMARAQKEAYWD
ncbi:MAG: hypothetical protein WC353_06005 [Candidatus Peribacter sp.]|jgi:hypothetical protein